MCIANNALEVIVAGEDLFVTREPKYRHTHSVKTEITRHWRLKKAVEIVTVTLQIVCDEKSNGCFI
jgi:hypothetical protein